MFKKIAIASATVFLAFALYLLLWPTPVDPVAWEPPAAPALEGVYASNNILSDVQVIPIDGTIGHGPEDVAVDASGYIYAGLHEGRIVKISPDLKSQEIFADTSGRPLGLHFDLEGNLIVADSYKGLLSINPDGLITVLATEANGLPFKFTDDVDIAANGVIYFTDASHKFGQADYKKDAIEHRPSGRLLAWLPQEKRVDVLLDNLYFANGVAVSPDQQFVLVNETWAYRIVKYWIAGDRAGQHEILIDNLPDFPDGVSSNGDGVFWVALASPRDPLLDQLGPRPFVRKIIARLPEFLQPSAIPFAFVLGIDGQGQVTHNLQQPDGTPFRFITSVQREEEWLYLGSLETPSLGRISLSKVD